MLHIEYDDVLEIETVEDGGVAVVARLDPPGPVDPAAQSFFVRLTSYDLLGLHEAIRAAAGRRVRVIICDAEWADYSAVTRRRLTDGARAMALPTDYAAMTPACLDAAISALAAGAAALQSLDDLGSAEANNRATNDMVELIKRLARARAEVKSRPLGGTA